MKIDINKINDYYSEKIKEFGFNANGMDWKDENTQTLRFQVINEFIEFNKNPSILDIGCGNAEYHNYCLTNKLQHQYKGLDINPLMVEESNSRFGAETALLVNGLDDDKLKDLSFNYVICSGTFNAKLDNTSENWKEFFYDSISKMFHLATHGVIFNCMTPHVDYEYDRLYYPDLNNLTTFIVKNLSRDFRIQHAYPLYEMTIFIKKP